MDTERIEGEEDVVANEMRVFHRPHPSISRSTSPDFGFVGKVYVGPTVCSEPDTHPPHTEGSLACPGLIAQEELIAVNDVSRETPDAEVVHLQPHTRFLPAESAITFFHDRPGLTPWGTGPDEIEAFIRKAQEEGRPLHVLGTDGDIIATIPAGELTVVREGDSIAISNAHPIAVEPLMGVPERVEWGYATAEEPAEPVRIDDERLPAEMLDDIVAIATGAEQELHMDERPLAQHVVDAVASAGMTIVTGPEGEMHYELTATGENLGPVYSGAFSIYEGLQRAIKRRDEILKPAAAPAKLYPPRHLGRIPLTHEALHRLLGVPEGMKIVDIYYDQPRLQLMVTVEGDSLFPVPPGTHPMELSGEWKYVAEVDDDGETTEYGRLEWFPDAAGRWNV